MSDSSAENWLVYVGVIDLMPFMERDANPFDEVANDTEGAILCESLVDTPDVAADTGCDIVAVDSREPFWDGVPVSCNDDHGCGGQFPHRQTCKQSQYKKCNSLSRHYALALGVSGSNSSGFFLVVPSLAASLWLVASGGLPPPSPPASSF